MIFTSKKTFLQIIFRATSVSTDERDFVDYGNAAKMEVAYAD